MSVHISNSLFYLHTPKCGGNSVRNALRDPRVFYVNTNDIELSEAFFDSLFVKQVGRPLIVHGHIHNLGRDQKEADPVVYSRFLRTLYEQIPLIFPTRHPADLLQSWMHYSKTRANRLITDMIREGASTEVIFGKNRGMFHRIARLKQNDLELKDGRLIVRNRRINLSEENEEENLHLFIDYLLGENSDKWVLRSMQFQLMAPVISSIKQKINQGVSYEIVPPKSGEIRPVFYYDSQDITDRVARKLDQYTFHGFSDKLRMERANPSTDKPTLLASSIKSVDERLMAIIPGEYCIYDMSFSS